MRVMKSGLVGSLVLVQLVTGTGYAANLDRPFLNKSDDAEETTWQPSGTRKHTWGLIGSGVGLVAGVGLAMWVKSEADDRYDRYLATADQEVAAEAFNAAQRYDRATLIGWAMAQISFVSLVYFLTREGTRPLVPPSEGALIEPTGDGVRVGVRLTP